jgi:hypothetical protein
LGESSSDDLVVSDQIIQENKVEVADDVKEYTFAVGKGNYPNQIIDALQARGNWRIIPEDEAVDQADFYWRPINFSYEGYHRIDKRLQ